MRTPQLSVVALGASLVFLNLQASAQIDPRMPDAPNRPLVVQKCSSCHDLSNLYSTAGRSRESWNSKIDDMILYGMTITPEERGLVLDYLAAYLPP